MKKIFYRIGSAFAALLLLTGCEDFFDPATKSSLQEKDYMQTYSELLNGYMGVSKSVMNSLEKSIYLEGLRGESLEPTQGAPVEFWDVYNYVDQKGGSLVGNWLADPKDYYAIIINANDYIKHAVDFNEAHPGAMDVVSFNGLVGGAIRYKVWAYLMLAKIYGEAVYLDDPLIKYQDISKYPLMSFDEIIYKCYDLMHNGMYGVNAMTEFNWAILLEATSTASSQSTQDLSRNRACPSPDILLVEINLWMGNYAAVKTHTINIIRSGQKRYDGNYAQRDFCVDTRRRDGNWMNNIYQYCGDEHIAGMRFDYNLEQLNDVVTYFSDRAPNKYYMRPTKVVMDRFVAAEEKYRGNTYTYDTHSGNYILRKLTRGNESTDQVYRPLAWISMYRAKQMYAFLAEALLNMGRFEEGMLFLNGDGLGDASRFKSLITAGQYRAGTILEGYPVELGSSRYSNGEGYNYLGLRSHVAMPAVGTGRLPGAVAPNPGPSADPMEDMRYFDSLLVEETLLEFVGESTSLYTMIRNSQRWGADARATWAAAVAKKYNNGAGDASIQALLEADIKNWFIKYPLQ